MTGMSAVQFSGNHWPNSPNTVTNAQTSHVSAHTPTPVKFGLFSCHRKPSIKAEVLGYATANFDTMPAADETYRKGAPPSNKGARVKTFLQLLGELTPASSFREAYRQMTLAMLAVENVAYGKAQEGLTKAELPNKLLKPRWLFAPSEHWMSVLPMKKIDSRNDVKVIYANGHRTFLGQNGAMIIQLLDENATVVFQKAGSDGRVLDVMQDIHGVRFSFRNADSSALDATA